MTSMHWSTSRLSATAATTDRGAVLERSTISRVHDSEVSGKVDHKLEDSKAMSLHERQT